MWRYVAAVKELFQSLDFWKFYDKLEDLKLQYDIDTRPCSVVYNLVRHFMDWFDIEDFDDLKSRLMNSLISNLQLLLNDVIEIIQCLSEGNFSCVGEDVGQILYVFLIH
eukprot:TRINITY_DN4071_c0_g1_i4.p2 TRINITY_DN4071_c0_g1~~TRINITY_DN4071_c0_g1_i4.p2  ORF type:complete len:109 (-),score=15.42 TRINITY_DN4071_c0_g1_i4:33-359(-)